MKLNKILRDIQQLEAEDKRRDEYLEDLIEQVKDWYDNDPEKNQEFLDEFIDPDKPEWVNLADLIKHLSFCGPIRVHYGYGAPLECRPGGVYGD